VIRAVGESLEVIGTGGDPHLGGDNFDDRIVDWMQELFGAELPAVHRRADEDRKEALRLRLKAYAEESKIALCDSQDAAPAYRFQIPSVDIFEGKPVPLHETLTMVQFEDLIRDLMEKSLKWVDVALEAPQKKHGYTTADLTAILLVGGGSRVPLVGRMLEQHFPNTEIRGRNAASNPMRSWRWGRRRGLGAGPGGGVGAGAALVDVTGTAQRRPDGAFRGPGDPARDHPQGDADSLPRSASLPEPRPDAALVPRPRLSGRGHRNWIRSSRR